MREMQALLWLQFILTLMLCLVIASGIATMFLTIRKGMQLQQMLTELHRIVSRMENRDRDVESNLDASRQRADEVQTGTIGGGAADAAAKTR